MFKSLIQKIAEIRRCTVGTDRFNHMAVKALIKPAVIVVLRYGGSHHHTVIVKIL